MASRVDQLPENSSRAAVDYYLAAENDRNLFGFLISSVTNSDYMHYIATRALEGADAEELLSAEDQLKASPGRGVKRLKAFRQDILELFLSRQVDNFNTYLVEMIRSVLHKQPRILSDRKQELSIKHILRFDSIDSLVRDIVESKISSLSYEGLGDLEDWCKSKGIPLVVPGGSRARIIDLISTRNLVVHNRCNVDERYKKATNRQDISIGDKLEITTDHLFGGWTIFDSVVRETDLAVCHKFILPTFLTREEISRFMVDKLKEEMPSSSQPDA